MLSYFLSVSCANELLAQNNTVLYIFNKMNFLMFNHSHYALNILFRASRLIAAGLKLIWDILALVMKFW